jgi:hypothetical protein
MKQAVAFLKARYWSSGIGYVPEKTYRRMWTYSGWFSEVKSAAGAAIAGLPSTSASIPCGSDFLTFWILLITVG